MSYENDSVLWIWGTFLTLFVLGLVYLFIVGGTDQPPERAYTASEYAQAITGIREGVPYHLAVGGTITGDSGRISGGFDFFLFGGSGSISGSTSPSESVKVGITRGRFSYIAAFPFNDVSFEISRTLPSSATFRYSRATVEWDDSASTMLRKHLAMGVLSARVVDANSEDWLIWQPEQPDSSLAVGEIRD